MAIQAVGASAFIPTISPHQAKAGGGAQSGRNSADSTTVISKSVKVNADGSVTTTITYADGHQKTETTAAAQAAAIYPQAAASKSASSTTGRGSNLDLTA